MEEAFNAEPDLTGLPNLAMELPPAEKGAEGSKPEEKQPTEPDKKGVPGEEKPPEVKEPPKEGDKPPIYKGVDLWNPAPESIDTPEKMKEHLAKVQAWSGDKAQEWKGQVDEAQGAHQAISQIVAAAATDPEKIPMLLRQNEEALKAAGVPINHEALNRIFGTGTKAEPAEDAAAQVQKEQETFIGQAQDYVLKAGSEEELGKRIGEMLWKVNANASKMIHAIVPQLEKKLTEKLEQTVKPMQVDRQSQAVRQSWNSAVVEASTQPGMEGIKAACDPVKQPDGTETVPLWDFIQNEPLLKNWARAVSVNPEKAKEQGVTHAKILVQAYKLMTESTRLEDAKTKARDEALSSKKGLGEIPGIHAETIPAEGQEWEQIQKDIGDPFRDM